LQPAHMERNPPPKPNGTRQAETRRILILICQQ
jgi:hypothetical protein